MHFLISWFHAIVQERLRFTPIGWSKHYEFNESDQRCALEAFDQWIDKAACNRTNLPPEKIPWDAMRVLLSQSIYGGKVDNEFDTLILSSLVDQFFRKESFNQKFPLFQKKESDSATEMLYVPECRKSKGFQEWINNLPSIESPMWSGLPVNVERILKEHETFDMIAKLKTVQGTDDDMIESSAEQRKGSDSKARWLNELGHKVQKLLQLLPNQLDSLRRTSVSITNPLFRFLEREITVVKQLLEVIKNDLLLLSEMCNGNIKSTNKLRDLAQNLHADVIPPTWRIYSISNIPATLWVLDFTRRLKQLQKLASSSDYGIISSLIFYSLFRQSRDMVRWASLSRSIFNSYETSSGARASMVA